MSLSPPTFSHSSHSRYTPPKSLRVSQPTIKLAGTVPSSRESHPGDPKPSFHTLCDTIPTRFTRRQEPGTGLPNYNSTNDAGDFCCETCHRVFPRARRPDFERHVDVHYPELARGGPLLCCGLPVEQVKNYHESDVMVFYDRRMVGGCGKLFSRTDALKRHLESARRGCVGDLSGDWHPPKQRK
ncbi:hypothetical protein BC835DRAFT_1329293 [Cytidiella melzeri]|nr:hypothetical protein BC835DRAFT_1329293 [Cytidiella melzeri]